MIAPDYCFALPLPGDDDYPEIPDQASLPELNPDAREILHLASLQANPSLIFLAARLAKIARSGMPEGYSEEELPVIRGAYLRQLTKELAEIDDPLVIKSLRFCLQGMNYVDASTIPFGIRCKIEGAV